MPADEMSRAIGKPLRRRQEITTQMERPVTVQAMRGARPFVAISYYVLYDEPACYDTLKMVETADSILIGLI